MLLNIYTTLFQTINLLIISQIKSNILHYLISLKGTKNSFNFNTMINYLDFLLLTIVIFALLGDLLFLLSSIINHLIEFYSINGLNIIHHVADTNSNVNITNNTTTTIIHDGGSWSNGIRSLIIYGAGGYRLILLRNVGYPGSRAFIIGSTIVGYALSRVLIHTINDPEYVRSHVTSWRVLWKNFNRGEASVNVDPETINKLKPSSVINNKFIGGEDSLFNLSKELLNGIFDKLKFILEPVQVPYSNEILSQQINDLSILLFILSLSIFGLIVILLLNIVLYINMDRIINFFKNKFIRGYLLLNKKFLGLEIFMLGGTILWFMYSLIKAIHFIATHPIIIN